MSCYTDHFVPLPLGGWRWPHGSSRSPKTLETPFPVKDPWNIHSIAVPVWTTGQTMAAESRIRKSIRSNGSMISSILFNPSVPYGPFGFCSKGFLHEVLPIRSIKQVNTSRPTHPDTSWHIVTHREIFEASWSCALCIFVRAAVPRLCLGTPEELRRKVRWIPSYFLKTERILGLKMLTIVDHCHCWLGKCEDVLKVRYRSV